MAATAAAVFPAAADRHLSSPHPASLRSFFKQPLSSLSLSFRTISKPYPRLSCSSDPSSGCYRALPVAASDGHGSSGEEFFLPFDDKPREECGVFGVIGDPEAASICKAGLHSLQHRGQEGAGIVSSDGAELHRLVGIGLVSEVFREARHFETLQGSAAIGHNRYSTAGAAGSLANVQPFLAGYRFGKLAVAHNGNLVNYKPLRDELESKGSIFNTSSDTEVILHLIATSTTRPLLARIVETCEALEGAYSLLFLTENKLFAVRDPHGFRPLVMGRRRCNNAIVFASETCTLDLIGADFLREVNPGEVVVVDGRNDMEVTSLCLMPKKPRRACVFEHIYFALPNSVVFGHAVHNSRYSFGAALARESPAPGTDIVIPVPDSGLFAALGFAEAAGIPFRQGLIRSHYVARTFIQPDLESRRFAVKLKLLAVKGILKGKSVVVVDDSIVRGTTSSMIIDLIKNDGEAREVHMRIASPPIVGSCYYGVDTPRSEELISNRLDVEGMRQEIGCESLAFLSIDSLRGAFGDDARGFCEACFTSDYPVLPRNHEVNKIEVEE